MFNMQTGVFDPVQSSRGSVVGLTFYVLPRLNYVLCKGYLDNYYIIFLKRKSHITMNKVVNRMLVSIHGCLTLKFGKGCSEMSSQTARYCVLCKSRGFMSYPLPHVLLS